MWLRLLAGEAFGLRSAVQTHSPLFYAHVVLEPGARVALPQEYAERAAYLVSGAVSANGQAVAPTQMIVFDGDAHTVLQASAPSVLMHKPVEVRATTAGAAEPIGKRKRGKR